jgi:hypothetical protein
VDVHDFEFVNVGSLRIDSPQLAVLRERQARQAPDGTWHRVYGLVDGQSATATSADGNFAAWEKQNWALAPTGQ